MTRSIPHFLILLAAFLWALDGVFFLPHIQNLNVVVIVWALHLIPFLLLGGYILLGRKTKEVMNEFRHNSSSYIAIAILGGFGGTYAITQAFFAAYGQGLDVTPIFFLQKVQPIFALALAYWFLKEKPGNHFWGWALLALGGSYLLSFGFEKISLGTSNADLAVASWATLAAFCWGASTVLGKKALKESTPLTASFWRFGFTFLFSTLILLFMGDISLILLPQKIHWIYFVIIALTTGGLSLLFYYNGLKKVKASTAALLEMTMPLWAAILTYLVKPLIEKQTDWISLDSLYVHGAKILGGLLLWVSVLMIIKGKKKITGTLKSGYGKGAFFVPLYSDKIEEKIGYKPFPGTLNLELNTDFDLIADETIPGFTHENKELGTIHLSKINIKGEALVVVFPEKSTHSSQTIEVLAPDDLRKKWNLKDGDNLEVKR